MLLEHADLRRIVSQSPLATLDGLKENLAHDWRQLPAAFLGQTHTPIVHEAESTETLRGRLNRQSQCPRSNGASERARARTAASKRPDRVLGEQRVADILDLGEELLRWFAASAALQVVDVQQKITRCASRETAGWRRRLSLPDTIRMAWCDAREHSGVPAFANVSRSRALCARAFARGAYSVCRMSSLASRGQ
jgi:hypothetical protein